MSPKEKPAPIQVDTLDQKLLYDILTELKTQRRTIDDDSEAEVTFGRVAD